MTRFLVLAACALALLLPQQAMAKRVALIIANSEYDFLTDLPNPVRDEILIRNSLRHFDEILVYRNLGLQTEDAEQPDFESVLDEFAILSRDADVAVIYFAGHGMQGQGVNWLLPTNANIQSEFDLWGGAIGAGRLLTAMSGANTQVLFLDACRNYPVPNADFAKGPNQPEGLLEFNSVTYARSGAKMLIMYSAAPGMVANDGSEGGNSPYAIALAEHLGNKSLPLRDLPAKVQIDVQKMTDNEQTPFFTSIVGTGEIYLADSDGTPRQSGGGLLRGGSGGRAAVTPAADPASDREEERYWYEEGKEIGGEEGMAMYLEQFPNGIYRRAALARIKKYQQDQLVAGQAS